MLENTQRRSGLSAKSCHHTFQSGLAQKCVVAGPDLPDLNVKKELFAIVLARTPWEHGGCKLINHGHLQKDCARISTRSSDEGRCKIGQGTSNMLLQDIGKDSAQFSTTLPRPDVDPETAIWTASELAQSKCTWTYDKMSQVPWCASFCANLRENVAPPGRSLLLGELSQFKCTWTCHACNLARKLVCQRLLTNSKQN